MRSAFLTFVLCCSGVAHASYFEFCALTGQVASVPVVREGARHFSFYITRAEPAKCGNAESYSPEVCRSYQGKLLEITLPKDEILLLDKDVWLTLIQRIWYAELADDPGYRASWQQLGDCQAIPAESGK